MTQFIEDRIAPLQKRTDSSGLRKQDTKVIALDAPKDTGVALDFAGELNAIQQRMQAADRGTSTVVIAEPSRLTELVPVEELAGLSYTERLLHDAKQRIDEEEYTIALDLLDELLGLEPEEDARGAPVETAVDEPSPVTPEVPTLVGVASGKGWARRNDPCPCGSGKKYKRCHGA